MEQTCTFKGAKWYLFFLVCRAIFAKWHGTWQYCLITLKQKRTWDCASSTEVVADQTRMRPHSAMVFNLYSKFLTLLLLNTDFLNILDYLLQWRLFVGAPKAQSEYVSSDQSDRGGALFKCPIDTTASTTPNCTEVELDSVGKQSSHYTYFNFNFNLFSYLSDDLTLITKLDTVNNYTFSNAHHKIILT